MHKSVRHSTVVSGIEVISITSDRSFPRHTHDEFGLGYLVDGAQKSWSGRGLVESEAGDVTTANPGEMHEGVGRKGYPRHRQMLFLTPDAILCTADWYHTGTVYERSSHLSPQYCSIQSKLN